VSKLKGKLSKRAVVILAISALVVVLGGALAFAVTPAVTGLAAADTTEGGSVTVSWDVPGSSPTGWHVQYKQSGEAEAVYSTNPMSTVDTITATITGLVDDVEYEFRVRSYDGIGTGDWAYSPAATPSDQTKPVTTVTFSDPTTNAAGWFNSAPTYVFQPNETVSAMYAATGTVEATATQVATATTLYTPLTAGYLLSAEGTNTFQWFSVDNASTPNTETANSLVYRLDSTHPTESIGRIRLSPSHLPILRHSRSLQVTQA